MKWAVQELASNKIKLQNFTIRENMGMEAFFDVWTDETLGKFICINSDPKNDMH